MKWYLIESPHTSEECLQTLQQVLAAGYLTHFYWGCKAGDHTGYVILEADTKEEALLAVPAFVRQKAQVVELVRFDPAEVKAMHGGSEPPIAR